MSSDERHPPPAAANPLRGIASWPARFLIALVRGYQAVLSPLFGGQCRFHPSCSEYFIQAVMKYGALGGAWRGVRRVGRCHPFHPGGYDPP
jgi:putative membrane protein insertion efficiency factor